MNTIQSDFIAAVVEIIGFGLVCFGMFGPDYLARYMVKRDERRVRLEQERIQRYSRY